MKYIASSRILSACSSDFSSRTIQMHILTGKHLYDNLYSFPPNPKLGFRFTFDLLKFVFLIPLLNLCFLWQK